MKRLHYIQHVPFETPGSILDWGHQKKIKVTSTKIYKDEGFPEVNDIDCLVVMGGPMGIYEEKEYRWLKNEKAFIEKVIKAEKGVVGICLGSQLLACVLGSKVTKNRHKEIGWYPIQMSAESEKENLTFLPNKFTAFHWHGDTFELPQGASRIASSEGCENQGFIYNKQVGLQFHLEVTRESLNEMVKNGRQELVPDRYIQSENEILGNTVHIPKNNNYMTKVLNRLMDFK